MSLPMHKLLNDTQSKVETIAYLMLDFPLSEDVALHEFALQRVSMDETVGGIVVGCLSPKQF